MGKKQAKPIKVEIPAKIIPDATRVGENEVRHTIPADGFQRLVCIERDGTTVWQHRNLDALLTP
jgi:hypothetical protein